ncbi:MAG: serine/threonine protein phosphatase [Acidaminococcaceae bacterium]|nr:serine/threonine protein phosphatase [Acidaminococcaceae bacterium]
MMIGSRLMAVGDVHGQYEKLKTLMRRIKFDPKIDRLIFLGDLIDRGPESLQCFDYVMHLQKKYPESVIFLMGNHERHMLDYYDALAKTKDELDVRLLNRTSEWLMYGGDKTLPQLQQLGAKALQNRLDYARNLPLYYRAGDFYFCHAGVDPDVPLEAQQEKDLIWIREKFYNNYRGKETIVVGHTPIQNLQYMFKDITWDMYPVIRDNRIILCDTGACLEGGRLSCIDVITKYVWQA